MTQAERNKLTPLGESVSPDGHEAFERVLLDAISDFGEGVVVTEAGRCVYANDAYCEMTGYSREELMALPNLLDLAPEEERVELADQLRERLSGVTVHDQYKAGLVTKHGHRKRLEIAVKLLPSDSGATLVALIRDVTERERLEWLKDLFAARVAHEIKNAVTPLTGIISILVSRFEDLDQETLHDMLTALDRQGSRLKSLLDRMLDLAKFERGELKLTPQRVHVLSTVRNVLEAAPPNDREISVDVPEDLIAWVDPVRLDQILTNLLSNALKYGGTRITIEGKVDDDRVLLLVTDDGRGIPPATAEALFEAFARGASSERVSGAGLGLAIVRAYARASGGDVIYEPGDPGSRFIIELRTGPEPE